jgi:hypothetical protein
LDEWINDPPSEPEDNTSMQSSPSTNHLFLKNTYNQNNQPSEKYTSLSSSGTGGTANYGGGSSSFHNIAAASGYNNSSSFGTKNTTLELSQEELDKFKETRKLQNDSNPFFLKSTAPSMKKSESFNLGLTASKASSSHDSIKSQSIDLKQALNIPGVTSSENYYRMSQIDIENQKLRKKMKAAKKKGKKSAKDRDGAEEEEEDSMPVVKVGIVFCHTFF